MVMLASRMPSPSAIHRVDDQMTLDEVDLKTAGIGPPHQPRSQVARPLHRGPRHTDGRPLLRLALLLLDRIEPTVFAAVALASRSIEYPNSAL